MKHSIAEKLAHLKKGTPLYSPAYGNIKLVEVQNIFPEFKMKMGPVIVCESDSGNIKKFSADGCLSTNGECMLFPSETNRNWDTYNPKIEPIFNVGNKIRYRYGSKIYVIRQILDEEYLVLEQDSDRFTGISLYSQNNYVKIEDFDFNTLEPFDKVLIRQSDDEKWKIDFYECFSEGKFVCMNNGFCQQCVPYCKETSRLLNTSNKADDKYLRWER